MAKLHELLAAEKTPNGAWHQVLEETHKKFGNPGHYFEGHSKSLKMIAESPENEAVEAMAREEKPVATTVLETLEYALDLFGKAEDLQLQKNTANQHAEADVELDGEVILYSVPVDELLGLEARLSRIRDLFMRIPTLDASMHWVRAHSQGMELFEVEFPLETTKTEKQIIPIQMAKATDKHPEQVQAVQKDVPVGKFTTIKRSGAVTALQKANAIKRVDALLAETKRARMRANEQEVPKVDIAYTIVPLLLEPFRS